MELPRAGWFIALGLGGLVTGCAQFRPPADEAGGGGGGGGGGGSSRCAVYGYPYTYADENGTKLSGGEPTLEALRLKAKLGQGEVYAGVGLVFNEPKKPFDASKYEGVAFTARRTAGSTAYVRFKVPDVATDPSGGVCTECYNDFGIPFEVTEEPTRFEVRFADLAQEADWGAPRPPSVDAAKLYGLQWQVVVPGASVDVSIGDVAFLGCGGES